ncbi:MAG: beta-lactamase family protein [Cyclobacteriaceae bacterium]|nr:beta-lactamase family protein [Cyclobacteriaceae bacterium]
MKNLKVIVICILVYCAIGNITAQDRIKTNPEKGGFETEKLIILDSILKSYVTEKKIAGGVALIARKGEISYLKSFGMKDVELNIPMTDDAIFRIASMTKAVTTIGVMMLFEEGHFKLDDPISKFIPEFSNMSVLGGEKVKQEITIRHLLTHTSGLSIAFMGPQEIYDLYTKNNIYGGFGKTTGTIGEMVKRLAKLPLVHQPGEKFQYGTSADVLGYMIEIISGNTLADFFKERIFDPLSMSDTYFYLPKNKESRLAALYGMNEQGQLQKIVGEAKSGFLNYSDYDTYASNKYYYSGGGGLLSTVSDYYKLLQMLLNNGIFNDIQILSRETVEMMTSNQTDDLFNEKGGFGFGFAISKGSSETGKRSKGSYSWLGLFRTHFWVDPKQELIGILLTQTNPNKSDIHKKFNNLVYQSIAD